MHARNIASKQGGSLLIEPCKPPEMIAGSDKGSDSDPFAELDKDEWASWVQSACAKASVFALGFNLLLMIYKSCITSE